MCTSIRDERRERTVVSHAGWRGGRGGGGEIESRLDDGRTDYFDAFEVARSQAGVFGEAQVLSLVSKGGVPRSAMGSKFITPMQTASVLTQFRPATMTPGLTRVEFSIHGPSPPAMVRTASTMARWMGRAPTRSTTVRGTR